MYFHFLLILVVGFSCVEYIGINLQQHGDYATGRFGQVVMFIGRGPWNDESLYHGTLQLGQQIESVDQTKPWAQFSLLIGESIMPPSAFDIFVKQTKIRKTKGLNALAIVIRNSDISNTIKHQLSEAYSAAGVEYQFFNNYTEAAAWLNLKGYSLTQQAVYDFIDSCEFARKTL